jgi:hypothetical protein
MSDIPDHKDMEDKEEGNANSGNPFTGVSAGAHKENVSDKTRESFPILGSAPASGITKKDCGPQMYTEQRESVEHKLSKMTEMDKMAETEPWQVESLCSDTFVYFQDQT